MTDDNEQSGLVSVAGHSRFTEQVAGWVREALRHSAMGERISWDVALQLMPTPQGALPVVLIYATTPSPVLGDLLGELSMIEPARCTQPQVDRVVGDAVGKLMASRRKASSAMNGSGS